ncbi:MAG: SH3 domain-containing protein [Anaerolineae bacterium]|nr:SH3 domain-containing protein [Anaerolineae bacterium]
MKIQSYSLIIILILCFAGSQIAAQQATATPLQVEIITSTPVPVIEATLVPTFTPSPEVQSAVLLEAKASAGDINIRADPDIEADQVGQIRAGDQYVVTGRFFRWFRFRYEDQEAWVFEELVDILGDVTLIEDLSAEAQPTDDLTSIAITETLAILQQTPGAVLSLTADTREIQGATPVVGSGEAIGTPGELTLEVPRTILPTFTYPPAVALLVTEEVETSAVVSSSPEDEIVNPVVPDFPPVVPIMLLAGFGLLGLIVSTIRSR